MRSLRLIIPVALLIGLCMPVQAQALSCGWTSGWLARENALAGTPGWASDIPVRASGWDREAPSKRSEGYFNRFSVGCGEKAQLRISQPARIEMYRIGYYNGTGARLLRTAVVQKFWSFTVGPEMPPGQYLVKIKRTGALPRFVPIMIIDRTSDAPLTFISSVYTWQAYNRTGGKSLYRGEDGRGTSAAKSISFDRPYDNGGTGRMRWMETPLVTLLEENGADINYLTDDDVTSQSLAKTQSIVLPGHSEYWSDVEYQAIVGAVNQGINLIAFGGNTGYRFIDIDNRTGGNRKTHRSLNQPESLLLGSQYFALGFNSDLIVKDPAQWPFSAIEGRAIKGIYGYEVDSYMAGPGPAVQVLATSAHSRDGMMATTTYYTNEKGAGILNFATNGWVCAMENVCAWGHSFDEATMRDVREVTRAVLRDLTQGPLGKIHPAAPTVDAR